MGSVPATRVAPDHQESVRGARSAISARKFSRHFHLARLTDLLSDNTDGLTRREAARLIWSHACGVVKP
jgi:hypothetical protein